MNDDFEGEDEWPTDEDWPVQPFTPEEIQKFRVERIKRIMEHYKCTQERALTFIDLREEGHGVYQASVMAGIADPNS